MLIECCLDEIGDSIFNVFSDQPVLAQQRNSGHFMRKSFALDLEGRWLRK